MSSKEIEKRTVEFSKEIAEKLAADSENWSEREGWLERVEEYKRRIERLENEIKMGEEDENRWRRVLGNEAAGKFLLLKRAREKKRRETWSDETSGDDQDADDQDAERRQIRRPRGGKSDSRD